MKINIVVSCTAGKNLPCSLSYDDYTNPEDWLLDASKVEHRIRADELYKGPGADKAREIANLIRKNGYDVEMWILSAGFGLVRGDTLLPGYDATFSAQATANKVLPKDYQRWLTGVTKQDLPEDSVILLPRSYLVPAKYIIDDGIQMGPFGGTEREIIGCSMIRVQLEASYRIIEHALKNKIPKEDWGSIKLEDIPAPETETMEIW